MEKIKTLSIEEKLSFAKALINLARIEDQDIQQKLYTEAMNTQCFDVRQKQYDALSDHLEKVAKVATVNKFMDDQNITDPDMKQELYLAALSFEYDANKNSQQHLVETIEQRASELMNVRNDYNEHYIPSSLMEEAREDLAMLRSQAYIAEVLMALFLR
jgi:hypothetical protein